MRSVTLPCALALAATAVLAPTASAAAAIPFSANHQDRCMASATVGELAWASRGSVAVAGWVALRDPQTCVFPSRPQAVAVFTAYTGRTVVDAQRQATPVGSTDFRFTLTGDLSPTLPVIDRVTVQVCHNPGATSPTPVSCGPISTYTP